MVPEGGFYLWAVLLGLWREATSLSLSISVPERVPALSGSCVVIPCSFTASTVRSKPFQYQVRLRYRSHMLFLRSTAFSNEDHSQVHPAFRGRTALSGDPTQGDCSVRIEGVTVEDQRLYEVWLKERGASEWKKSRQVILDVSDTPTEPVISDPGTVMEGQLVTLNCTVRSPCPAQPPQVHWKWERGSQENSSIYQARWPLLPQGQEQVIISPFSFTASSVAQPRVRCEAQYPGGKTTFATKELYVKFPPRDVMVHVLTLTVQEGASALLSCSCKSDPPVSEFQWWYSHGGHRVGLPQRTHTIRLQNVTRDLRVHCLAQNYIGWAESGPTSISMQYKPAIFPWSLCHWETGTASCHCAVDANPKPAITWSVNGSSPADGYNTSISVENGTLMATLSGNMDQLLSVVCYAYNALGNDTSILLYPSNGTLLWKVVPAVCVLSSLSLFLALLLLLHRCRRKTAKHILNCRTSSVYPGNLGMYQERTPLYINCTEVTHIYTNGSYQLVYQNCTPLFVRNKQVLQRERRVGWTDRRAQRERRRPETGRPETDTETHVYLEII
ncbi:hypothetical protein AAFF_G00328970 [Aldrovandia affinis]|uniref:Ig-like domain-containing protein n=1 Tax=Aldrovandia affinis TaxID=143900 RepID=A0AAD7SNT8_9TELE|nr:hypothetical protein AAFF_G00328970 [Aldrovandia affinis]